MSMVSQPSDQAGQAGNQPEQPADGQQPKPGAPPAPQPWMQDPQPGYGTPPSQGYGTPASQGYGTPPSQGYGTPPSQGYGTPPSQGYPGYPAPGQGYPAYPQPGYGRYPGYGYPGGKDPALAEWWRRLLARIIDWVVLGIIFSPLWYPPWHTFLRTLTAISNRYPGQNLNAIPAARTQLMHAESHFAGRIFVVAILFYLVSFVYDWVQHAAWGQTIGKRALGTKVVMADGRNIGAGPAGGRAAVFALPGIVPFVGGLFSLLNELWLTWDPRRQCLHDKAAHTVVIKKNYLGSPPTQAGSWQ